MDANKFSFYLIVGTSKGSNVSSSLRSIGTEIRPKDNIENSEYVTSQPETTSFLLNL